MKNLIIVLLIVLFIAYWVAFAFVNERTEQKNSYIAGEAKEKDSINSSLRKIRYCATFDLRTVKWRRSIISATIVTILLFLLLWMRLPSPSEIIIHILVITAVFSAMWDNFNIITSQDAAKHVDSNIQHIKSLLVKNHSFIMPW